jgi:hypothetical protein
MANEQDTKSLEMRVAALEDKLSKVNITEDEMKAFQKVSALMGASVPAAGAGTALSPQICTISRTPIFNCWRFRTPIFVCECQCGPCNQEGSGGGGFGGGFSGLGS